MFDKEKWIEILISVGRHKTRTILTAFGVSWGIFMLVILLGVGNGLQNGVENLFKDDALNAIWFYPGNARGFNRGLRDKRQIQFRSEDAEKAASLDQVDMMSARYYLKGSTTITYGTKSMSFDVRCVHPDHKFIENTIIRTGRFINQLDIDENRKTACIGIAVVESLFSGKNPVGEYINVNSVPFLVVGDFRDEGSEREEEKIYLPITTAQKVFEGSDIINQFTITSNVTDIKSIQKLENEVRYYLGSKYNFDPKDTDAISVNNSFEEYLSIQGLFKAIDSFIWFVGLGSIFAGIIGISNIMLIVVNDRRVEIGVRKALGAKNKDIIQMILHESIFITSLAGYLGLAFGIFLLYLMEISLGQGTGSSFMFTNPEVQLGLVFLALLVLIIAGAFAGILPALKAVKINPAESMRK